MAAPSKKENAKKVAQLDIEEMDALGTSGLRHKRGVLFEEFHKKLRGSKKFDAIEEMTKNHAVTGALLHMTEMILRQVDWQAAPPEDPTSPQEAEESVTLLEQAMGDMSCTWEETLTEILTMIPNGHAYCEVMYKVRMGPDQEDPTLRSEFSDGKVGWRKIALRAQRTLDHWEIERDGGIRGMWQRDPNGNYGLVFIPIEKAILFRTKSVMNNPEGESWLRTGFVDYQYAKTIEELEAIGIERDYVGLLKITAPAAILSKNPAAKHALVRADLEKMGEQVRRGAHDYVLFPSGKSPDGKETGFDMSLMGTGGRRMFDTNTIIGRHNRNIAMTMAGQFLFLGMDGTGARATSEDHSDIYLVTLKALLDIIEETLHRYGTTKLMAMNGIAPENRARWKHQGIDRRKAEVFVEMMVKALNAGAITYDRDLEVAIRERAGAPPPLEELDLDQTDDADDENLGRVDIQVDEEPEDDDDDEDMPDEDAQPEPN